MRIAIAGAGNVGRSIARELGENGHDVLLIEKNPAAMKTDTVPGATWVLADACEMKSLEDLQLDTYDVAIAATGDDKANLVHTLLAKTEFGVPRTVGRVNHPGNEWMFDDVWGVDVSVSTPRLMSALVEEAVSIGDLVRLFSFGNSGSELAEMTLPATSPIVGRPVMQNFGADAVLVALIRGERAMAPDPAMFFEGGDRLMFITTEEQQARLERQLAPDQHRDPDQPGEPPSDQGWAPNS